MNTRIDEVSRAEEETEKDKLSVIYQSDTEEV
jgi:hypothetical protein